MSYNNNRITAPVSIRDVQRALGVSVQDLGTLCKHENINKWARYKPVRSLSKIVRPVTFAERKAVNFGLDVPWCASYRITTGGQIYIDMLNGIAYDAEGKRIFVTGKNWSKLFEIKLIAQ